MRSNSKPRTGHSLSISALSYAARGWPVLPLVPNEKRPLTKNGLLDASINPSQISEWWSRWPNANIGLRTGEKFDVLDIDGEVGRTSLAQIVPGWAFHPGPISRTGRGEHWLFLPGNTANRAALLPKLDWRGVNGYIVAPPSIHPDGHMYHWVYFHGPDKALPPIPDWLSNRLSAWTPPREPSTVIIPQPYGPLHIIDIAIAIGLHPQNGGGGRFKVECPFHEGDREPSLVLYPDSDTFYCFGCQAWGDMYDLKNLQARYKYA